MSNKLKFSPGQCCCGTCESMRIAYCERPYGTVETSDDLNYLIDKVFPNGTCGYIVFVEVVRHIQNSSASIRYYLDNTTGKIKGIIYRSTETGFSTAAFNSRSYVTDYDSGRITVPSSPSIISIDPEMSLVEVKVRSQRENYLTGDQSTGNFWDDRFFNVDCGAPSCADTDVEIPGSSPADFGASSAALRVLPPIYAGIVWAGSTATFADAWPGCEKRGEIDFTPPSDPDDINSANEDGNAFSVGLTTGYLVTYKSNGSPYRIYKNNINGIYSPYDLENITWYNTNGTVETRPENILQPKDALMCLLKVCTIPSLRPWTASGASLLCESLRFHSPQEVQDADNPSTFNVYLQYEKKFATSLSENLSSLIPTDSSGGRGIGSIYVTRTIDMGGYLYYGAPEDWNSTYNRPYFDRNTLYFSYGDEYTVNGEYIGCLEASVGQSYSGGPIPFPSPIATATGTATLSYNTQEDARRTGLGLKTHRTLIYELIQTFTFPQTSPFSCMDVGDFSYISVSANGVVGM